MKEKHHFYACGLPAILINKFCEIVLGIKRKMGMLDILKSPEIDNLISPRSYVDEPNVQQDIYVLMLLETLEKNPD